MRDEDKRQDEHHRQAQTEALVQLLVDDLERLPLEIPAPCRSRFRKQGETEGVGLAVRAAIPLFVVVPGSQEGGSGLSPRVRGGLLITPLIVANYPRPTFETKYTMRECGAMQALYDPVSFGT